MRRDSNPVANGDRPGVSPLTPALPAPAFGFLPTNVERESPDRPSPDASWHRLPTRNWDRNPSLSRVLMLSPPCAMGSHNCRLSVRMNLGTRKKDKTETGRPKQALRPGPHFSLIPQRRTRLWSPRGRVKEAEVCRRGLRVLLIFFVDGLSQGDMTER